MGTYRAYTNEDVIRESANVKSISALLRKLNLRQAGGNYCTMKSLIQTLNIDCSHWTGSAWNRDAQLKDWTKYKRTTYIKKHLIKKRGHCCETCKLQEWTNKLIPLEIHHIDGDRTNNEENNLKLLCCNCHALTDNWRNKKRK